MSSDNITVHHGEEINKSTGVSNKKLLMWAFLGSDVMFFGTFIGTFMAYRNKSLNGPYPADTLDIPITTVSTFVLLMSSLGIVLALHYLKESRMVKFSPAAIEATPNTLSPITQFIVKQD